MFTPSDPRLWSSDLPIWIVGIGSRTIFHKGQEHNCSRHVLAWLEGREEAGWHISWPEAEGTLEAIKSRLMELSAKPTCEKPKKQDYAATLGRLESIRHLAAANATPA